MSVSSKNEENKIKKRAPIPEVKQRKSTTDSTTRSITSSLSKESKLKPVLISNSPGVRMNYRE